ncbi:Glycerol-3-phosphate dehydrogenase [NAD(P)+] [Striga asiatica]|uniref:Glycerol-3-phosphate dehydrogenase [NAD(P)+] n=1 Tax=Striga asiatica TaxID=4170 RepID=A0A5A7QSQ9_STRAF|nr:Glycerol-3-phosphate dehydrogenase [NAD(P)+] [Striga asiatica]
MDGQDRDEELRATRDVKPTANKCVYLSTPDYGHGRRSTRNHTILSLHKGQSRDVTCTTHSENLLTCLVLPIRVHGQQYRRPRKQVGGGVLAGEENGLTLLHDIVRDEHFLISLGGMDHLLGLQLENGPPIFVAASESHPRNHILD